MANSILTRELKWAIKLGSTWNTHPGAFAAGDQMLIMNSSGWQPDYPTIMTKASGQPRIVASQQKPQNQPAPSFTIWGYEADNIFLLLLGLYFGDDVVTGAGDPYTHTMEEQDSSDFFAAVNFQEGDEVKGAASYMQTLLEIQPDTDGIIEFISSGIADLLDIFTSTYLDNATKTGINDPYEFDSAVFRINDQDGIALASGDEIKLVNWKISLPRPAKSIKESANDYWSLPKQNEHPEPVFEIELENKSAAAKALDADFRAKTMEKLDMTFSGTSADREVKIECPAARILTSTFDPEDRIITAKFSFALQKAQSAPTGMTGLNNTCIVKTSYATDILT